MITWILVRTLAGLAIFAFLLAVGVLGVFMAAYAMQAVGV